MIRCHHSALNPVFVKPYSAKFQISCDMSGGRAFRKRRSAAAFHDEPIESQGHPLPLGDAVGERRGLERLTSFKELVSALAFGDDDALEELRRRKPLLWKS